MLKLPATDSPLRELFDVAQLATLGTTAGLASLPTFRAAKSSAAAFLKADPAAKSVCSLVLRADGAVWLCEFTRRTWRRKWNFGNPRA